MSRQEQDDHSPHIFDAVQIPISYKMGFITNRYREPSFRRIEQAHGLTRPETLVLIFLAVADGSTASQICAQSGHLKTNISRAVQALETKGLVHRRASADDQRRQLLYITDAGRALHDQFMPGLTQREMNMLSGLSKAEVARLDELLAKVCLHMAQWDEGSPP